MKRTPLKRSTKPIKRDSRIKNANRRRKAKEFARAYGSKKRVEWMRSLSCCVCGAIPSENAHTENGGMGRKAGYETIVPLCREHHYAYDLHLLPFDSTIARHSLQTFARNSIERLWQRYINRSETP